MKKLRIIFLAAVLAGTAGHALAQSPGEYDTLAKRRAELTGRQEAVQDRLTTVRKLFGSDEAKRDEYGAEIMRLEKELFGLRDSLQTVSARLETLEAAGISPSGTQTTPPAGSKRDAGTTHLPSTDFIRRSLPAEDYERLVLSQEAERVVDTQLNTLKYNYDILSRLAAMYADAERGRRADSLYRLISLFAAENDSLAASVADLSGTIIENKTYAYNYILDRENRTDILPEMERLSRDMFAEADEIAGEYMYDSAAFYPLRKELTLAYEVRIAEHAGLKRAADSLRAVSQALDVESFRLSWIDIGERIFIDYADYAVTTPPVYNNSNPIPETEIFEKGTVFRIFVGAFPQQQPVSTFRNVSPVSRELKSDKKHYYYIGGYRTFDEAHDAAARLKAHGFRNPRVVVWEDGVYTELAADARPGPRNASAAKTTYRIEIRGAGGTLPANVSETIKLHAPGKEISRFNDSATGGHLFVVGFFDKEADAESLAAAVISSHKTLDVKVTEIK